MDNYYSILLCTLVILMYIYIKCIYALLGFSLDSQSRMVKQCGLVGSLVR